MHGARLDEEAVARLHGDKVEQFLHAPVLHLREEGIFIRIFAEPAVDARAFLRADYIPHLRLSVVALFPARECVVGVYLYGKVLRRVDVLDEHGQPARGARRFGAGGEVFRQRSASRDAARPVGMHRYLPALGDLVAAFAPVQRFQPVSAPDVVFECGYKFQHLRASAFFIDYITFLSAAQRFAAKNPLFLCFCSLFYMRAAARERLLFMRKRATI